MIFCDDYYYYLYIQEHSKIYKDYLNFHVPKYIFKDGRSNGKFISWKYPWGCELKCKASPWYENKYFCSKCSSLNNYVKYWAYYWNKIKSERENYNVLWSFKGYVCGDLIAKEYYFTNDKNDNNILKYKLTSIKILCELEEKLNRKLYWRLWI